MRYCFSYGNGLRQTVTVTADSEEEAVTKAKVMLDRRYEKAGKEPPVAWTLELRSNYDLEG